MLNLIRRWTVPYVSYKEVKALANIVQVAEWLGLELRNNRAPCPINAGDHRELVITPAKDLAYCYGCKKPDMYGKRGGDQIWLTSHIKQIDRTPAAMEIQKHFHGYVPAKRGLTDEAFAKIISEMEFDHPEVQAAGLSPERARELGIGWRNGGTKPKMVLIPIRDAHGRIIDFAGYSKDKGLVFSKHMVR